MFRNIFITMLCIIQIEAEINYKIVGGKRVGIGIFPYMATLQHGYNFFCAGTIYNRRFILTAAHCFNWVRSEDIKYISATVGTDNLYEGGNKYPIKEIIRHPKYNPQAIIFDVALIRLNSIIIFNKNISPVQIDPNFIGTGIPSTALGWGKTEDIAMASTFLQAVNSYTISNTQCSSKLSRPFYDHYLCVHTEIGRGACGGDSGGPLIVNNKQVGINSFGSKNCALGYPDVYIRISSVINWIIQVVG